MKKKKLNDCFKNLRWQALKLRRKKKNKKRPSTPNLRFVDHMRRPEKKKEVTKTIRTPF
jgi:hypothetical protein